MRLLYVCAPQPEGKRVSGQCAVYGVYNTTTISRLIISRPAWWGCSSAADRERVDRFLRKLHRAEYSHKVNFDDLIKPAEKKLLCKVKTMNAMSSDRYSRH